MLASIEISLSRERNQRLLRGVGTDRLERRLRANRGSRPGSRRTVEAFVPRGFATPSARPMGADREGVRPKDA